MKTGVTASFTLDQRHIDWIAKKIKDFGDTSKSSIMRMLIDDAIEKDRQAIILSNGIKDPVCESVSETVSVS